MLLYHSYLSAFILVFLFNIFSRSKGIEFYLFYLFIIISFLITGSRYETGTDYLNYYNHYNDIKEYGLTVWHEPLYVLITVISQYINESFEFFILVWSFLTFLVLSLVLQKITPLYLLSFICYAGTYLLSNDMGTIRDSLASGILLFSVVALLNNNYLQTVTYILIASNIHRASILYFTIFLLKEINFKNTTYLIILLLSLLLGYLKIFENILVLFFDIVSHTLTFMDQYIGRLNKYLFKYEQPESVSSIVLLKKVILVCYFLYFRNEIIKVFYPYKLYFNIYFFGTIIYFSLIWSHAEFAARTSSIFVYFEFILLPMPFLLKMTNLSKLLIFLFIMGTITSKYYMHIYKWYDYFVPYQSSLQFLF